MCIGLKGMKKADWTDIIASNEYSPIGYSKERVVGDENTVLSGLVFPYRRLLHRTYFDAHGL